MQSNCSGFVLLAVLIYVSLAKICGGADATGLAPGVYKVSSDGKFNAVTNADLTAVWPGVWNEGTNGLRVQLSVITNGSSPLVRIGVGSIRYNSLGGYVGSPNSLFKKFELLDINGLAIPFKRGKSNEGLLPARLSINKFPRWPDGGLKSHVSFFTNAGPFTLADMDLKSLYQIQREGDYVLTVCPVIYQFGTNIGFLDRVNLPCGTTKIHLKPFE